MNENEMITKRILDLANKAYQNNIYTFTNFLNAAEYSEFLMVKKELPPIRWTAFGGTEDAERLVIRFGSPEDFGYEEDFPICCLKIQPANMKFSDDLTHRDLLGALMHLGIERNLLGDLLVKDKVGYVFCLERIAPYIIEELIRVKHTVVKSSVVHEIPKEWVAQKEEKLIQAESERIDGVIAKVYKMSRSEVVEIFRSKQIFVNAALEENNSRILKAGDLVSVRGYGKFSYEGQQSISKKGKLNILLHLYVK